MTNHDNLLPSEAIQMLISSMTAQGHAQLTELEVERFLNAVARVQSGVPTGASTMEQKKS